MGIALRPAGRRARLPAGRRPRGVPRGLPRARGRARARAWPSASSTRRPRSSASSSSAATTTATPRDARAALARRRGGRRVPRRERRSSRAGCRPTAPSAAKVERLLEAQARGDAAAMARELDGLRRRLPRGARRRAARLRGPAKLEIVRYDSRRPRTRSATQTGPTRVVWQHARDALPTVQCVARAADRARRSTGPRVTLAAPQRADRAGGELLRPPPQPPARARVAHPRADAQAARSPSLALLRARRRPPRRPPRRTRRRREVALRRRARQPLPARRRVAVPPRHGRQRPQPGLPAPDERPTAGRRRRSRTRGTPATSRPSRCAARSAGTARTSSCPSARSRLRLDRCASSR